MVKNWINQTFYRQHFEMHFWKVFAFLFQFHVGSQTHVESLWPSDVINGDIDVSTLAQVMACSLMAPIQWEVLWHSSESNFIASAQATVVYNEFENYTFKINAISPTDQWVNEIPWKPLSWCSQLAKNMDQWRLDINLTWKCWVWFIICTRWFILIA